MGEVERKFLIAEILPKGRRLVGKVMPVAIQQGYLITEGGELRVRKWDDDYFIAVKSDGTGNRDEWEEKIPQWAFETLWPHVGGRQFKKLRYLVEWKGHTLEINVFRKKQGVQILLEVEFSGEGIAETEALKAAEAFTPPNWLVVEKEVTDDKRYYGKSIALNGFPEGD